jgi:CheY-like chemotaxis protein
MGPSPLLLLVEDNEDDLFLMMRALKNAKVDLPLRTASDGQQAMDCLAAMETPADDSTGALPVIVLLDINLPQISGFELLAWIRARPKSPNLIVIMLTSSNHPMDIRRAYELGANSYIVKPASYEQLLEFARLFKAYWLSFNRSPV